MISLLLWTGLLLAPADAPATDEALARQVSVLVRRLDAGQLAERDEAERELLTLGPEILPLLPDTSDRTPAEVALRVNRVRQQLLRTQAIAATRPSLVTLRGEKLPLEDVLAEISKQTGNPISDHRDVFGQRQDVRTLNVEFNKTPYWQALDEVLDQAGLTLYGFAGERGAFAVNRAAGAGKRSAQASYAGTFRLAPLRFEAQRDLQNEQQGVLRLLMEVSWEPRLQPFAILQPLAEVSAVGNTGDAISPLNQQAEPETLIREGFSATELEVPLELPARGVKSISTLKGKLVALVPGPPTDFRFDSLPIAAGGARPRAVELRQGGTIVTLDQVRKNNDIWAANLRIRFEAPTTALESHRSWILDNQAAFEDTEGNRITPGGLEQTMRTKDEIGVSYLFDLPNGPQGLSFIYRTPLVILELPVVYEFHDLELP